MPIEWCWWSCKKYGVDPVPPHPPWRGSPQDQAEYYGYNTQIWWFYQYKIQSGVYYCCISVILSAYSQRLFLSTSFMSETLCCSVTQIIFWEVVGSLASIGMAAYWCGVIGATFRIATSSSSLDMPTTACLNLKRLSRHNRSHCVLRLFLTGSCIPFS